MEVARSASTIEAVRVPHPHGRTSERQTIVEAEVGSDNVPDLVSPPLLDPSQQSRSSESDRETTSWLRELGCSAEVDELPGVSSETPANSEFEVEENRDQREVRKSSELADLSSSA